MSDQQPHAPSGALQLPRQTTPTWEIELLVSGATVFGLMQLPPLIDSATVFLVNRVDADIGPLILPIWIYLQFTLWTLIGTFILHLAMRGYWVALVGLHSVYPGGVRWEHFKRVGPYMLETSRAGNEDVPTRIEAADNRASLTFGVGFGLALVMLVPATLVLVSIVVALAARWVGGGVLGPMVGFWFVFGVGIGPFLLAVMLDQAFGKRWSPASPGVARCAPCSASTPASASGAPATCRWRCTSATAGAPARPSWCC